MLIKTNRKFGNFLINKEFQIRIIFYNFLYLTFIIIITSIVIQSPLLYDMLINKDVEAKYQAAQSLLVIANRLIPTVITIFVLFFFQQLLMTHKICGPLVNFSNTFKKISQGDLTRKINLRKGDYLKTECDNINQMIEGLAGLIAESREDHQRLIRIIDDILLKSGELDTPAKAENALKILKQKIVLVKTKLLEIKLEGKTRV
ncbi:MAG: methyl-accepting chemotaxis protein [bacterium]